MANKVATDRIHASSLDQYEFAQLKLDNANMISRETINQAAKTAGEHAMAALDRAEMGLKK
jgi:hypothetical protein